MANDKTLACEMQYVTFSSPTLQDPLLLHPLITQLLW